MWEVEARRATVRILCGLAILAALLTGAAGRAGAQALFESRQITPSGEYTSGIEGPAVDADGILYVPNLRNSGTIGRLKPGAARSEPFTKLPSRCDDPRAQVRPGGSIGNGIRFDRDGRMYVADFNCHNVFVIERGRTVPRPYFHSARFNQPNDLAIAADGTLYASDPSFKHHSGQVWRITRGPDGTGRGEVMSSERTMGTTNGIDLSPDGTTLYVGESETHELWAYRLDGAKLVAPWLVKKFDAFEIDGLRTDVDGRIFVTRPSNGTVAVLTPDGNLVREIALRGKVPTNLTFGGADGKTVFVTQRDGRFIEAFLADRPGREPCLQVAGALC